MTQVHGARVVVVTRPGQHAGVEADAAVTAASDSVLAIRTADCAPVLLADPSAGVVGAAHAGWRGVEAGVLGETVAAMVELGASVDSLEAHVGPCISAAAYEFGVSDLTRLALRHGPDVVAATAEGRPALDLRALVTAALAEVGVPPSSVDLDPRCTASATGPDGLPLFWSHRARADGGRQVSLTWLGGRDDRSGSDP